MGWELGSEGQRKRRTFLEDGAAVVIGRRWETSPGQKRPPWILVFGGGYIQE